MTSQLTLGWTFCFLFFQEIIILEALLKVFREILTRLFQ